MVILYFPICALYALAAERFGDSLLSNAGFALLSAVVVCGAFHWLMRHYYATKFWKNLGVLLLIYLFSAVAGVVSMPVVGFVRANIFEPFVIQGSAMEPNYRNGKYLFVQKWNRNYERLDVVIFKYPHDTSKRFIKRIVGLPGETVEINDGKVMITAAGRTMVLDEPYIPGASIAPDMSPQILYEGQYFVLGDNRAYSSDSQDWGPVAKNLIIGKIVSFR